MGVEAKRGRPPHRPDNETDRRRRVLEHIRRPWRCRRVGDAKVRDEELRAVAIAGDGAPFAVGLVWLIRDTRANRELLARYPNFFATRFPGSGGGWLATLIRKKAMPTAPGLLWSDVGGRTVPHETALCAPLDSAPAKEERDEGFCLVAASSRARSCGRARIQHADIRLSDHQAHAATTATGARAR